MHPACIGQCDDINTNIIVNFTYNFKKILINTFSKLTFLSKMTSWKHFESKKHMMYCLKCVEM